MTKLNEIYKCDICGNIVEMVHGGIGNLVCCNQPMKKMEAQTSDWATEKHVPIGEMGKEEALVRVGSTPHPMTEEHHIEWIEVVNGDYVNRKYLKPGERPEAEFCVPLKPGMVLREYCNIHGLWKNEL